MKHFRYTAIDREGREVSGTDSGESGEFVERKLRKHLLVVSIEEVDGLGSEYSKRCRRLLKWASLSYKQRVQDRLLFFTRQMVMLLEAKLPLAQCLESLIYQEQNKFFRKVLEELTHTVRSGLGLSVALEKFPHLFDNLYVQSIKAGESGGFLIESFRRLLKSQQRALSIKRKIKLAMIYPMIVAISITFILVFLSTFVVPKFQHLFYDRIGQAHLPLLTQIVIDVSLFVKLHWGKLLFALGNCSIILFFLLRCRKGNQFKDRMILFVPKLNGVIYSLDLMSFSKNLSNLLLNGVPMLDALKLSVQTVHNSLLREQMQFIPRRVQEGLSLSETFRDLDFFSPLTINMIHVGEHSGQLIQVLDKIGDFYEEETELRLQVVISLLEPLLIVGLALSVGCIVIALFLPLSKLIQSIAL